jgi:hypothetical protein
MTEVLRRARAAIAVALDALDRLPWLKTHIGNRD